MNPQTPAAMPFFVTPVDIIQPLTATITINCRSLAIMVKTHSCEP